MSIRGDRETLVSLISGLVRRIPRVKGLGIFISLIADRFKDDDIAIEKPVLRSMMRLRTNDLIGRSLIFTPNYFDWRERRIINEIVRPGDYVVDVGANIGAYALFLSKLVGPSGHVDAIEAEEKNARELRHNIALNSAEQVTVHQVGVSDKKEILSLMLNTTGNAGGHSFYDQSHIPNPETQSIACVPLSIITAGRRARFMKLDIEGFEHRVLRQFFQDTPKNVWPEYLMVEDNPERREDDAIKLCTEQGYDIIALPNANTFLRLSGFK
jgi:FkbM family methyltransferase